MNVENTVYAVYFQNFDTEMSVLVRKEDSKVVSVIPFGMIGNFDVSTVLQIFTNESYSTARISKTNWNRQFGKFCKF